MPQEKTLKFPIEIKVGSARVKIYRVTETHRDRYTLAYYEGTRRNIKQFSSLEDAKAAGRIAAENLNNGQGCGLELSGRDKESYLHALKLLKPLNMGLVPALEEYAAAKQCGVPLIEAAKAYAALHNSALPARTISAVVEELFIAKKADGVSAEYLRSLRSYLGHFARDFKDEIARITTQDLDAWFRALSVSPRSRNNYRTSVITLFRFAKSAGYLRKDGDTVADATSLAKKQESEIEVFTPAEMATLLAHGGEAIPFLVLGGFCGLRSAEVTRLKWEDLDWTEKVINIKSSVAKTRTRRLPPLPENALAWLEKYKDRKGLIIHTDRQRVAMRKMLQKSGVEWKKNALRHGFGTYRMAVLKDPVRVAYEMGNSPSIIRAHYDRVVTESEGHKWFGILPDKTS